MAIPLETFRQFVRDNPLGVIATTDHVRGPEAALLTFIATDEGDLLFDTLADARKVRNIESDARAAAVIGTGTVSIQVEGICTLPDVDQRLAWGDAYEAQYPGSSALQPEFTVVRLHPTWLRCYDASGPSAVIHEGVPDWA